MNEIKCPKCGEVFKADESAYSAILKQVRDKEFQKLQSHFESEFQKKTNDAVEIAVAKANAESGKILSENQVEIERLKSELMHLQSKYDKAEIDNKKKTNDAILLATTTANAEKDKKIAQLEQQIKVNSDMEQAHIAEKLSEK